MRCTIRRKRFLKDLIKTFNVPKEGKVSDKTFTYNIVAGVLGILLCLTSLTAATWAWFGSSITTQNNSIQSGQYFVEKTVAHQTANAEGQTENVTLSADEKDVYTLKAGQEYRITLVGQGSVSTGYCKVTISEQENETETPKASTHTQQIFTKDYAAPTEGKAGSISFDLLVSGEKDVQLTIEPCWGTSAIPDSEKLMDKGSYTYSGGAIKPSAEKNDGTANNNANESADNTATEG